LSAADGRIAVVVPFYQRAEGLLARALRSIFDQEGAGEVLAIVVDDASPRPALEEFGALSTAERERVLLVEQANAGPGAARNRALDALPAGVEAVAYLDSDDWWSREHLARAREVFSRGFDLYLSNWIPLESRTDAYAFFEKLDLAEQEPLAEARELYAYRGDFFTQELARPIGRLSTMVFARERFGELRFATALRCAFEDRLYRLEMARMSPRIALSASPECFSGEGVNLFSGKRWGTAGFLDVARDELAAARLVRARFRLDERERALVAAIEGAARAGALTTLLRLVLRDRRLELARTARLLAVDPLLLLRAPGIVWRARQGTRRRNTK
jgi:succinoglycan biosynthesis protein ExoW